MSLKKLGSVVSSIKTGDGLAKSLKSFSDITEAVNAVKKAGANPADYVREFAEAFSDIEPSARDAALGINKAGDAVDDLGGKGKNVGTLGDAFTGLGAAIVPLLPIILGVVAALGALAVADTIRIDYDEAQSAFDEKKTRYENTRSELESLKSSQNEVKSSLQELANQYNVTFNTSDTLDTMIAKLQQVNMTLDDRASLESLTAKTGELERQVEIQTQLAEIQQKSAATAAKVASETKDFNASAMKAEMTAKYGSSVGGFGSTVKSLGEDWLGENGKIGQIINLPSHLLEMFEDKVGMGKKSSGVLNGAFDYLYSAINPISKLTGLFGDNGLLGIGDYQEKDSDALKTNIDLVSEYSQRIKELQSEQQSVLNNNNFSDSKKQKEYDKLESDIQNYTDAISIAEEGLSVKSDALISQRAAMVDSSTGATLKGYEIQVKSIDAVLAKISGKELSGYKKQLADIKTFFDGSDAKNSLSNYLTDIAKSDGDVESAMKSLGLDESSFNGTSLSIVSEYFKDIAKSAQDAADAVNEVDGSISGIGSAMESENGGDNFVKMKDYLEQADELLRQGLTGTDDFKTVEKTITQGTGKSYQEARGSLDRYYTTNQDENSDYYGELTRDGIDNFVNDYNEAQSKVEGGFKTTGAAAKAFTDILGKPLSTQSFEMLMGRVSDYDGFENAEESFSNMVKTSEQLSDARKNLNGLKEIYDSMDSGSDKEALKMNLDNWENQINQAENDLTSLPDEVVTKLKFEYDKAQLEQANEAARQESQSASNSTKRDTYASILANDDTIISKTEENVGKEVVVAVKADTGNYDEAIVTAQKELDELVSSGADDNVVIQAQMKVDEAKQNYTEALEDMSRDGKININVESDTEEVQNKINSLESGQSIEFHANVDGVIRDVQAVKNEDGSISYVGIIDGVQTKLYEVQNEDGTVTYTANTNGVESKVEQVKNKDGTITYTANTSTVDEEASAPVEKPVILTPTEVITSALLGTQTVNQVLGKQVPKEENATQTVNQSFGIKVPSAFDGTMSISPNVGYFQKDYAGTLTLNVVKTGDVGGVGGANGTANSTGASFATGTAFASGVINKTIPYNVFSDEKYRTSKSQMALTGELGQELVVNAKNNSWRLVGSNGAEFSNIESGSIIFNHKQTEELLKKGSIKSRGSAHSTGTALASGGIVGNITDLNRPSSKKDKDSEDDSFSEIFDHISIWLNRLDRSLENFKDSIGDYTEDLSKQNSIAQDVINQTRGSLSVLQSAYDTYMAQANAVELEDNWKGVVNSGEIRISEITDEDLKQRIEDYQKYYEQALDAQDKIYDAQRDLLDLAQEKLSNIENYYQNRYGYNEDFGYNTDIDELKKALKEYQNELGNQMDSGVIKQGSDAWYQAQKTIAEYLSNILEATWNKLEYVIDGLDRVSDKLDNVSSLEEAKGNKLTEKDYQAQINTNNKSIQAQNNLRNSYVGQMGIYDVGSKQYQDLAEKIAQCDDEIFKLREDNEDLKDSIWDARFTQPLDKLKDKYSAVIDEADKFRDLMDSDSFVAKDGSLTSNGLANIAMIMQGMNASKQITADYTASLKKLDGALKNNIISQSEYDEQQKDILDTINDSVGTTENYKNELIDIYKEMAQSEVDSQNKMIDKQKEYMNTQKDAYEYSKKIQSQSKNANQLRSQIAALEGVSNQSAQTELKRLKQQLAEQEDEITETKKDHEYTVRIDGLDSISDSLTEALDTTLDEITYNAEKQESIVKEMLGHVVNAYGTAYGQINSIIKDTGFHFGYNNSSNIGNIGNASGAQDQFNQATTNQPNVKPSDTITNINTGTVNNTPNIDKIVDNISKPINTTNRKVAEIKLNKTSLSIQEGGSSSLSISIRPTDAKNKSVKWTSSNPAVATVSGGNVSAKKPGSATITVATTDGSGLSASCGVSVTEKPKPKPPEPTPAPSSGGDGNPRVGDVCTLNGMYFYDSWGTNPGGSMYNGVQGGVVIDNYSGSEYGGQSSFHGEYGVHIKSADGKYGDLGWVRLDQLSGYASGTRNATAGLHQVDELGNELKLKTIEHNGKKYTMFDAGDQVFKANMSSNLFDFGNNPTAFIANNMPTIPDFSGNVGGGNVNIHYDKLIEVKGNVDKDSLPELKEIISQAVSATKADILKSYNKHK